MNTKTPKYFTSSEAIQLHEEEKNQKLVKEEKTSSGLELNSSRQNLDAAHTPTPWHVVPEEVAPVVASIHSANGKIVAVAMATRDANFACSAVNAHEELITERDRLLQVLETRAEREVEMLAGVATTIDALVAALWKIQKDNDIYCGCECNNENCCNRVGIPCAKCDALAGLALARAKESK